MMLQGPVGSVWKRAFPIASMWLATETVKMVSLGAVATQADFEE